MSKVNYRSLPKLRDSISYVYIEHAILEQDTYSLVAIRNDGRIPIPVSSTTCLLLGPGTSITHAAVKTAAENGCMILWCGERVQRFYAFGTGETQSAENLLLQARLCTNPETHLEVARRMYRRRFGSISDQSYTLKQLRGMEGIRVREAYRLASKTYGIQWKKRNYKMTDWEDSDPVNQALSYANTILYGLCNAAIISMGFSPGLGFIHTGKQLSFVYDVADLYKASLTIPVAFASAKEVGAQPLEVCVRRRMRAELTRMKLLKRIPEDLEWVFQVPLSEEDDSKDIGELWDEEGTLDGGVNYSAEESN